VTRDNVTIPMAPVSPAVTKLAGAEKHIELFISPREPISFTAGFLKD